MAVTFFSQEEETSSKAKTLVTELIAAVAAKGGWVDKRASLGRSTNVAWQGSQRGFVALINFANSRRGVGGALRQNGAGPFLVPAAAPRAGVRQHVIFLCLHGRLDRVRPPERTEEHLPQVPPCSPVDLHLTADPAARPPPKAAIAHTVVRFCHPRKFLPRFMTPLNQWGQKPIKNWECTIFPHKMHPI